MSFIIAVYTNEGIAIASDSRITYTTEEKLDDETVQKNIGAQITDSTNKTFLCNTRIAVSTCGTASIKSEPIAGYIEAFIRDNISEENSVDDVSKKLVGYFGKFVPKLNTNFLVSGYDMNSDEPKIQRVYVGSDDIVDMDTSISGVVWDGETDILKRLIKNVGIKNKDGSYSELKYYNIGFNYFTLQDAIDFAEFAVDVTIKTMMFQDRVKTVGGPIDILVIKPKESLWIQRKTLHG